MNIAVINIRDIIKYACFLLCLILVLIIGIVLVKNSSFSFCLGMQVPLMADKEIPEKTEEKNKLNATYKILDTQLAMLYNINEEEELEEEIKEELAQIQNESLQTEETNEDKTIKGEENLQTKVIDENNITASFTNSGANVQVKNQSSYNVDELLANTSYEVTNKNKVIIYHTHTCESYTSSEKYSYEMTGAYRTTDLNYTVAKVGDELEECLKQYGKTVIHDKTYHDYPAYNGSYDRSAKTFKGILENNKDAEVAIDLHRDAVRKYKYIWT